MQQKVFFLALFPAGFHSISPDDSSIIVNNAPDDGPCGELNIMIAVSNPCVIA
jgi:hypothetical protein